MKKIVSLLETAALFFMAFPMTAWAAEGSAESISPAFCIPFAGLLLCVAVLPLIKAEWWESHQLHAVILWSLLFIVPFAVFFGAGEAAEKVLECIIDDYLTFIVLLFGLFCVSGNITLEGDLAGSPRINVGLLLLGTMLSSWVGTTGASMLMVRPMIKMNAWRKRRSHIMVFFIFLISNMGGCLTPIGDPPLLMGFMRGVPFFWSLHLLPILIFNTVVLLTVFYFLDRRAYRKDIAEGRKPDISKPGTEVHILGLHNLIFLAMIVAAIILSGTLPGMVAFQDVNGAVKGIPVFEDVKLTYPALIEVVIILAAAFLSFKTTKPEIRRKNHFTWGAIKEVAVCRYFYYHAAGPYDLKGKGGRAWYHRAFSNVLGNRAFVKLSGQYTYLSGISYNSRFTWLYRRNADHSWNCTGCHAGGNILWCCIYGSQYLYWKCTKLYGKGDL